MKFSEAYLKSENARAAAAEAGYTPAYGEKLVKNPNVQTYIAQKGTWNTEDIASLEEVMTHISAILRGSMENAPVRDQLKAAEALIKYHGAAGVALYEAPDAPIIIDNSDDIED